MFLLSIVVVGLARDISVNYENWSPNLDSITIKSKFK